MLFIYCTTKTDISQLFIFAQRALALVNAEEQKATWLGELKGGVKAAAEIETKEAAKLKTETGNFLMLLGKTMARAPVAVPEDLKDAPMSRVQAAELRKTSSADIAL